MAIARTLSGRCRHVGHHWDSSSQGGGPFSWSIVAGCFVRNLRNRHGVMVLSRFCSQGDAEENQGEHGRRRLDLARSHWRDGRFCQVISSLFPMNVKSRRSSGEPVSLLEFALRNWLRSLVHIFPQTLAAVGVLLCPLNPFICDLPALRPFGWGEHIQAFWSCLEPTPLVPHF